MIPAWPAAYTLPFAGPALTFARGFTMRMTLAPALVLALPAAAITLVRAPDTRTAAEPMLPPACMAMPAPLRTDADGPPTGGTPAPEDAETKNEAAQLRKAFDACPQGDAVEPTLGDTAACRAFLINPATSPSGVSLIVDGGVTVYAPRNPKNFQNHADPSMVCGKVGENYPVEGGCPSLLVPGSRSGVYGFGVLDGQGECGIE